MPDLYNCYLLALKEYTIDSRGDIGAWVREAAMIGLHVRRFHVAENNIKTTLYCQCGLEFIPLLNAYTICNVSTFRHFSQKEKKKERKSQLQISNDRFSVVNEVPHRDSCKFGFVSDIDKFGVAGETIVHIE